MLKNLSYPLFIILIAGFLSPATGSDTAKEKRWSEQISDSLMIGEAVQLKAGSQEFLGLYAPASSGPTKYAILLLHGLGAHPNWPEVIQPIRSELPERGWATLSIQMPILANDAAMKDYAPLFDEAIKRINAGVEYLSQNGHTTIVLVGHSLGASMGAYYLASDSKKNIDGFIAIGLSVMTVDDKMNSALALEKVKIPMLDLFGSRDLNSVISTRKLRLRSVRKAGNKQYRYQQIEGADHFFNGMDETLTRTLYGWLRSHFIKK